MKDELATLDSPMMINGRPFFTTQAMAKHVALVICGEYTVPNVQWSRPVHALDIGANHGAFTAWAQQEFPDCRIQAFEPLAAHAALFRKNHPTVQLHEVAVTSAPGPTVKLYHGLTNSGEASLKPGGATRQSFSEVPVLHPKDLPDCDILKIDTEGSELDILKHYTHKPSIIMLETHSYGDIRAIDDLLVDYAVFRRVQDVFTSTVTYIRRTMFNPLALI